MSAMRAMSIKTLDELDATDKRILLRCDFNSPIDPLTKCIVDDTRIRIHAETTIRELVMKKAKVVIIAHQGRPGDPDFTDMKEHAEILSRILGMTVRYVDDVVGEKAINSIKSIKSGEVLMLENVRTLPYEMKSGKPEEHAKTELVSRLAPLFDCFVNDAFSASHRAHASIVGFTAVLPSYAGRVMERELAALSRVSSNPEKPCVYVLGGAKADDSLAITKHVLDKNIAEYVLTGGLVGQLFLHAAGYDLGIINTKFIKEQKLEQLEPDIRDVISRYPERIKLPLDLAVDKNGERVEIPIGGLPTEYQIMDIGEKTIEEYCRILSSAKSVFISGPLGVFEKEQFTKGTRQILSAVARGHKFTVAGGGHTVAAIEKFGLKDRLSYVSTAGGALIEYLMGRELPGVEALKEAAKRMNK